MQFAFLFTFLTTVVGPLVVRVLTHLGIGAVSYIGVNILLDQVKSYVVSSLAGAGSETIALLGLAKVDIAINIVLSAVTARAVYAGMQSGVIKKFGNIPK